MRRTRTTAPTLPAAGAPTAETPHAEGSPAEALAAEVASLQRRLERLERDVYAGGKERKIPLEEIAARLRHAPSTIRAWSKDPERVRQYRLDLLLITSPLPNCEVYSTPRLLAQWEEAIRVQWQRVLFGGGRATGEQLLGERRR